MLDVIDVSKSYRGVPAVRRLTLTARPGQVIGLLGPNGSGKSTSVKMLVGAAPFERHDPLGRPRHSPGPARLSAARRLCA